MRHRAAPCWARHASGRCSEPLTRVISRLAERKTVVKMCGYDCAGRRPGLEALRRRPLRQKQAALAQRRSCR